MKTKILYLFLITLLSCNTTSVLERKPTCYCYYYKYYNTDEVTCRETWWTKEEMKEFVTGKNRDYPHVSYKVTKCKDIK